ncbi:hypothetical protein V1517DRAFT_322600 [Lipomyces orientalis]|uniref:Uncharacterized protein n=1 Tax=Lipomyces orientalis TaxID=1233043 RepID=A0ACC3TNL9_9ASCO
MAPLFGEFDPSKADEAVLSLFASSDGPVTKPSRSKRVKLAVEAKVISANDEEQFSDLEEILNGPDSDAGHAPKERQNKEKSSKKRKKPHVAAVNKGDDQAIAEIEDKYLQRLLDQEDVAPKKGSRSQDHKTMQVDVRNVDQATMGDVNDSEVSGDEEADSDDGADEKDKTKLVHDSLLHDDEEVLKAKGTVFVGNIPSDVISSRTDYANLKKHFAQYGKIKSIRFRSIAFSEMLPRKVAFIKQKLHDKRHTANAYIVYDSEDSARKSLQSNGFVLQGHHIRVDSVAHPAKQDSKRSVFIGNLDFDAEEESLWEHFGKVGEIEYVRVIRDSKTNVGKGFAYVQFKDSMYVAKALLLNDKKMGNRKLRVTRARPIRTPKERVKQPLLKSGLPKLDPDMKAQLGRAKKVVGKAERAQLSSVIEGERASQAAGTSLKAGGGGKKKGKPRIRARSTAFKRNKKLGGDRKKVNA